MDSENCAAGGSSTDTHRYMTMEQQKQEIAKNGVSPHSIFKLNSSMVETLSVVGATSKHYNFFEVMYFLNEYKN